MSRRMDRLGNLLRQEISRTIADHVRDPRLEPLLTVTRVDVSPGLEHAAVLVSVVGNPEQAKEALHGMESAGGFIRRELGQRLRLRQVPKLRFILDTSLEEGQRMLSLLDQIRPEEASPDG